MLALCDGVSVYLWQAIDIIVSALDAEVLGKVDYLHSLRDGMLVEECLALTVAETEEYHINIVERHV